MLQFLFFVSIFLAIYSYAVYPLLLVLLRAGKKPLPAPPADASENLPPLSLIITAYNEKARIEAKLDNTLALDYPGTLEIIVASDCSDDGTDDMVRGYADKGVKLVRADEHLGKEYAQKCAIEAATGDILVFSDVATEIPGNALQKLVAWYTDPSVGAVSSEDRFISSEGQVAGEGLYVRYEMWLRRLESSLAGLVGLSGSFFSCRREVADLWDIHAPSDFNTALNCARLGLRAVTAGDVLGYYKDLSDPAREYQRKVRTVLRGMSGLGRHLDVLNPAKFGLFALQVFSHKLMRWLVPVFLLTTLLLNLVLLDQGALYMLVFLIQLVFYGIGLYAHVQPAARSHALIRVVYFFLQVNVAIVQAWLLYFSGRRMAVWQPSQR
jgi:glycosyltransferase involved in cell wall biosynthesis